VNWYRKNAEAGDSSGQYNLGHAYHAGSGVERNFNTAAQWYAKAANQGHTWAQSELGNLYAGGNGVPINKVKAFKWWLLAAKKDDKPAKKHIKDFSPQMSEEELDKAKQLAKEFIPVETEATKKRRYRCNKHKTSKNNEQ
jgi:hypothetical protein